MDSRLQERLVSRLAAKFRAETCSAEPPRFVDPTDEAFDKVFFNITYGIERLRPLYPLVRVRLETWDDSNG